MYLYDLECATKTYRRWAVREDTITTGSLSKQRMKGMIPKRKRLDNSLKEIQVVKV